MPARSQTTNKRLASATLNSFWDRFETVNKHTPSDIEFYAYDKWRPIARTNHLYALICLINCLLVNAPASALSSLSRAPHLRGGCSEMHGWCYFDTLSDAGKTRVVKSSSRCAFHALLMREIHGTRLFVLWNQIAVEEMAYLQARVINRCNMRIIFTFLMKLSGSRTVW